MTIDLAQLAHIEALAKGATPGPWRYGQWTMTPGQDWQVFCDELEVTPCPSVAIEFDAEFIAAVNPAVVLGMVAELRRLRDALVRIKGIGLGDGTDIADTGLCYIRMKSIAQDTLEPPEDDDE